MKKLLTLHLLSSVVFVAALALAGCRHDAKTPVPAPDPTPLAVPVVIEGPKRVHLWETLLGEGKSDGAHLWFPVRKFGQSLGFYVHWANGQAFIAGRRVEGARIGSDGKAVAPLWGMTRKAGLKMEVLNDDATVIVSR